MLGGKESDVGKFTQDGGQGTLGSLHTSFVKAPSVVLHRLFGGI